MAQYLTIPPRNITRSSELTINGLNITVNGVTVNSPWTVPGPGLWVIEFDSGDFRVSQQIVWLGSIPQLQLKRLLYKGRDSRAYAGLKQAFGDGFIYDTSDAAIPNYGQDVSDNPALHFESKLSPFAAELYSDSPAFVQLLLGEGGNFQPLMTMLLDGSGSVQTAPFDLPLGINRVFLAIVPPDDGPRTLDVVDGVAVSTITMLL